MQTTKTDTPRPFAPLTDAELATLSRFEEAHHRLEEGLIRPEQTGLTPERNPVKWAARMEELRSFLAACGDPHRGYDTIHVTGTSGKGSVTTLIGLALHLAGYRVGIHTSPFLQSPTEKNWIAGELLGAESFCELVDWVYPVALPRRNAANPASIHGMASVSLCFEAFRRAEVEVAVVEAGCGGRFDLTNLVEPAAAVITNVGEDHLQSLGPTVNDVAWHKAGVIKRGAAALTGAVGEPLEIIRREAREVGVDLVEVEPEEGAPFWKINEGLARACLAQLRGRYDVPEWAIEEAARAQRLPARRELAPEPGREVILDGAHNPDKMSAFLRTAPQGAVFVTGFLAAKDFTHLIDAMAPAASAVVATEPSVYAKPPVPADRVARAFEERGVEARMERDPQEALRLALELDGERPVVVTGSLYLVGQIRERWYPTERVVLQRTSWPRP